MRLEHDRPDCFEPTAEEKRFLHALEVLFAPKPAPPVRLPRGRAMMFRVA